MAWGTQTTGQIPGWGGGAPSIMGSFQQAQRETTRANLERYKLGMAEYEKVISRYKKGGGFIRGAEARLERTKKKDVAAGMQSLVSAGLAGTTMAAGLGTAWEEEVGEPGRLSIADVAGQRISQAQMGKAGFIERRTDVGPDPGLISQLMQQIGTRPTAMRIGGGGRTGSDWVSPLSKRGGPQGPRRTPTNIYNRVQGTSRPSARIKWAEPTMGALGKRISYG